MGRAQDESIQISPPSEQVLRELYHSVGDAIFVHDAETGEILDVNEMACKMYGYERAELRQLTIEDLSSGVPPYTQAAAVDHVQKAAEGNPQVFDWQAEDSRGNHFWVEMSMQQTAVDDRLLVLVIVRDISERKRYEEQLEVTTEELEALNRVIRHDIRNDMSIGTSRAT